jgi:hypothetical protein
LDFVLGPERELCSALRKGEIKSRYYLSSRPVRFKLPYSTTPPPGLGELRVITPVLKWRQRTKD